MLEPAVVGGKRHHLRLADHRHDLELKAFERLADRQVRFFKMPFVAAASALGHLEIGERGKEARSGPALLVGLACELAPHQLDRR